MISYKDIKSVAYISQILEFAEELLGVKFKKSRNNGNNGDVRSIYLF